MQVREMIRQKLGSTAGAVEAALKESVPLLAGRNCEDPVSRLGGRPNLPRRTRWPTWRGQPLAFVAQLDLRAIPKIAGLNLPRGGSLFFFFEGGENSWGFSPEDRGSGRVLYSSDPLTEFQLRDLPEELEDRLRFKGVELKPSPAEMTVPDLQDQALPSKDMTVEQRKQFFDFWDEFNKGKPKVIHRVGGYPDCIQGDPKLCAHLASHGLYCGDSTGYKTGKERGMSPGATEWVLLLQVDSDDKADMMWGDVGRLYFLIHKTDLANREFDKTWVVFQCS